MTAALDHRRDAEPLVARVTGGSAALVLVVHLRALRGERSLKDAAAAIGIRPDELSKIEQGRTSQIRWETILRCALAYRCGIEDILTIERDESAVDQSRPMGAREAMLAAMRSDAGRPVPQRRLHVDRQREAASPTEAALTALAEATERGPVRRRFTPAGSR